MTNILISCAFCIVMGGALGFIVGVVLSVKDPVKPEVKKNFKVLKGGK